jgi:hypothetical protein
VIGGVDPWGVFWCQVGHPFCGLQRLQCHGRTVRCRTWCWPCERRIWNVNSNKIVFHQTLAYKACECAGTTTHVCMSIQLHTSMKTAHVCMHVCLVTWLKTFSSKFFFSHHMFPHWHSSLPCFFHISTQSFLANTPLETPETTYNAFESSCRTDWQEQGERATVVNNGLDIPTELCVKKDTMKDLLTIFLACVTMNFKRGQNSETLTGHWFLLCKWDILLMC